MQGGSVNQGAGLYAIRDGSQRRSDALRVDPSTSVLRAWSRFIAVDRFLMLQIAKRNRS